MPEKPLSALMREAQATSERYHKLANLVSSRIEEFDAWLAALPGKVEVETSTTNPNFHPDFGSGGEHLVVGIRRIAKDWCLAFAEADESGHPDSTYDAPPEAAWKPVGNASLRIKSAALHLLPQLVELFLSKQKLLIGVMGKIPQLERDGKESA
jgi:hypothetical protein